MTIDGQHFQRRLTQVSTGHTVVDPATAAATPPSSSYNSLGGMPTLDRHAELLVLGEPDAMPKLTSQV